MSPFNRNYLQRHFEQGFDSFLEWCVDVVGARVKSGKGHFRHTGLAVEIPLKADIPKFSTKLT